MTMLPRRLVLRGGLFLLMLLAASLVFIATVQAADKVVDLGELNWEYQWGDLPVSDNKVDLSAAKSWNSIDFPANPPARGDHDYAWFRTILPEANFPKPVIFITSIDLNVEVFLEDQLIYRFGDLDDGRFRGWPWHQIDLPDNYSGKPVYFRVYSDYTEIGLWGETKLMDRSDMLLHILGSGLHELIVAAFSLLVAFVTLVFALFRGTRKEFFYLGLFSLATAGTLIGENLAMQLLIPWPLFKTYLAAISYFSMPIFIAMLLYHWVNPASGSALLKKVAQFHFIYLLSAMLLSLSNWANLAIFFPVFDALFVLSLLIMLKLTAGFWRNMDISQRLVLGAFAVYAFLLLVDMLVAHGFLPWVSFPIAIGGLIFALALVVISIRNYVQTSKALAQLNEVLEQRVRERTTELYAYVRSEQQQRRELERENQFSAELEEFNVALQSCQTLSDATDLIRSRLASVFSPARVAVSLDGESANSLPDAQIRLQELEGDSRVLASLSLTAADPVLSQDWMQDFIQRAAERLNVTLGNIKLREDLQRYSFEDALTGLRNRRYFDDSLTRDIQLARRNQTALSLLICDIDHFKKFNDEFGHEAGDVALQQVATELKRHFRESDIPCRLGGEEFVVLMRDADIKAAMAKAEKLRADIADKPIHYRDQDLGKLTISIGVVEWQDENEGDDLLRRADKALYSAKQGGRNRVVKYHN